jgi:predicted TIM-barrel fold metal-dependent hydrolase
MRAISGIIDVHSHAILPIGQQPPATPPDWSVEGTLALMDAHGIQAVILSVPDAANYLQGQEARDVSRRINETLAAIVSRYPQRFGAMATLPGRDIDAALREMEYALDDLGMDGVSTSTSINDLFLGEEFFDPWFMEMDRRAVTLFIHPAMTVAPYPDIGLNPSVLEFMFNSTRMLANMVFSGAKERFSRIRMISTHAGGTLPFLRERVEILATHFPLGRGRKSLSKEQIRAGFASFYYDLTGSTTASQLGGLLDLVPPSQLLFGFDIPYMPASTIAPAISDIGNFARFTDEDLRVMARDNAFLLYPSLEARMSG